MQGTFSECRVGDRSVFLYRPPVIPENCPVVYCLEGAALAKDLPLLFSQLEPLFEKTVKPFCFVLVPPESWDDDYTPWPAPPAAGREVPFGGKADAFFEKLFCEVFPFVEETCPAVGNAPEKTFVMGYSLGGLAALYGALSFPRFAGAASVSGSLWYPGWLSFLEAKGKENRSLRVYLSLGAKEERSKDPLVSQVGEATRASKRLFDRFLLPPAKCRLEFNGGGHFSGIPNRLFKALVWMMEKRV